MRCAQDIFDRISGKKSMTKKWLYSAAIGALLIAGNAWGITVQEVFSNGFFSSEIRGTRGNLIMMTDYGIRYKKQKTAQDKDGNEKKSYVWLLYGDNVMNNIRWKEKSYIELLESKDRDFITFDEKSKLTARRPLYMEKSTGDYHKKEHYMKDSWLTNGCERTTTVYVNKPRKKNTRPIGPSVIDYWFPDETVEDEEKIYRFFGTERNAVTNIISDNEAYITGTVSQTGHVNEYRGCIADVDSSSLCTYIQHITTDDNHLYIEQEITENAQNIFATNRQITHQSQYVVTFNKGRCKKETETITLTKNTQLADWYIKYHNRDSQNTR